MMDILPLMVDAQSTIHEHDVHMHSVNVLRWYMYSFVPQMDGSEWLTVGLDGL